MKQLVKRSSKVMRNCCYTAATCIAVWLLFFYYLPAQSEPDMQDDVWYDMCITVSGKDGKWLWRQMMEHGIKIGTPPRPRSQ